MCVFKVHGRCVSSSSASPAHPLTGTDQVHVIGALPLRTLSRIYGALNEYTLPVWFRVPGFKLYGFIFGVNFDEVENDLQSYTSLSDFFMRRLKPGSRTPEEAPLVESCTFNRVGPHAKDAALPDLTS